MFRGRFKDFRARAGVVFALGACLAGWCPGALHGATLRQLSVDQVISLSTQIVRGTVTGVYVAQTGSTIFTHYRIQVAERFKGAVAAGAAADTADVALPGGSWNGLRQTFPGVPSLQTGVEYVLFLWTGHSGPTQLIGLNQGMYRVGVDTAGQPVATRQAASEIMLNASGAAVADRSVSLRLTALRSRISASVQKGSGQ